LWSLLIGGRFEACITNFTKVMGNSLPKKVQNAINHLRQVRKYLETLGIARSVLFSPLLTYNHKYYKNGLVFKVVLEEIKRNTTFAAGGNYTGLIRSLQSPPQKSEDILSACGVNIAWELVPITMSHYLRRLKGEINADEIMSKWRPQRVDVLVLDFGDENLAFTLQLLAEMWKNQIKADKVDGSASPEQVAADANRDGTLFIVMVRNQTMNLKVKHLFKREEVEIERSVICSWLKREIRAVSRAGR
jgi:translation initiation factor 2-alpha kinase 4